MKRFTINLFLMLTSLVVVSCDSDNDDKAYENSYMFRYTVSVRDINGKNLLNENAEKGLFSVDEVIVETLSDEDKVTSEINESDYTMDIKIKSPDTDGVSTHSQVLKWKYENETVTDTVLCEIEKAGNTINCKKIWVNNHLRWDRAASGITPRITLTRISPEHIRLRDEKSTVSRVEEVVDGIKFVFWLSDMDGNETNVFDWHEIEKQGFNFNLSVTNNTNEMISFNNCDLAPFLGYVFDPERKEAIQTYIISNDILIIHEVKPGETHYEKLPWREKIWWRNIDGDSIDDLMDSPFLSSGKYYTCFYKEKFNINIASQKEINIPPMFINIEIK